MKQEEARIVEYFGEKITYDPHGQFIWAVDKEGGHQKVADVRGWGHIQHLFKSMDDAARFQDTVGQFIADAISEKLQRLPQGEKPAEKEEKRKADIWNDLGNTLHDMGNEEPGW